MNEPVPGPFKCPDCDLWWAGYQHRCQIDMTRVPSGWVVRPSAEPIGSGMTTSTPWCGICSGWHIPGMGPCTATYSATTYSETSA